MKVITSLWIFFLLLSTCFLRAQTIVTLGSAKDNTLYDFLGNSNGAGQYFFTGSTQGNGIRRGLIQFDIAGTVPAGATIISVELQLNRSLWGVAGGTSDLSLHRLESDWGEGTSDAPDNEGQGTSPTTGDCTWTHTFFNTQFWTNAGGDYVSTASATGNPSGNDMTWASTPGMVADVQFWLDNPSMDFGWIIIGDESTPSTANRFDTKENPDPAVRPQLIIEYNTDGSAPLAAQIVEIVDVACNGESTGSATVSASGGATPYSYAWSNGGNSATQNNLPAGTYTVTITDDDNSAVTLTVDVDEPTALSASSGTITDVECNGASTGSANVNVSGGTSPYSYAWSNGVNSSTLTNVAAGTYTVTVTDDNDCTTTASVTIDQPTALSASPGSITDVACNGASTGSASVNVSGGTSPYSYAWSNGVNSSTLTNVAAGTYTVTVTDDNDCTTTASVTIDQPTALSASPGSITDVACNGASTGSASVNVSGGTSPYSYAWSNGVNSSTLTNVAAGTYTVTVTDDNDCTTTASVTIDQPTALSASPGSITDVACNGASTGSANVNVSGGTSPYTYAWSNGVNSSTLTNVAAGTYTVTVTDDNDCTTTASVTIDQPTALSASPGSITDVACNGASTGSASVNVSGGTSPYTYAWSNGAMGGSIDNEGAGDYTVTVTDDNGCTATTTVSIDEPDAIMINMDNVTDVDCNGEANGSAMVSASNGSGPYTYAWSNGAMGEIIDNVEAGTYTVSVTDDNGCIVTSTVTINEPDALLLNITATNETAADADDGTASAMVNGGTMPYEYLWSNGATTADIANLSPGTYTVTITDGNGCTTMQSTSINPFDCLLTLTTATTDVSCFGEKDGSAMVDVANGTEPLTIGWSNGADTASIDNLGAGQYTVSITDANNCLLIETVTINEPEELKLVLNISTLPDCPEDESGSLQSTVTGGTQDYTYAWSTGSNQPNLDNLVEGDYILTVTDQNGCIIADTISLMAMDDELPILTCPDNIVIPSCDSVITYELTFSDNCTVDPPTLIEGLGSGNIFPEGITTETYEIVDGSGNMVNCSFTVTIENTLAIDVDSILNASNGNANGAIDVSISGGTLPYAFDWRLNDMPVSQEEDPANLVSGDYTLIVTDAEGCTFTSEVITVDNVVGTTSIYQSTIAVYPNPTTGALWVRFQKGIFTDVNVQVFDLSGKTYVPISFAPFGEGDYPLQLPNLEAGTYYLVLRWDNEVVRKRFVIIKD